MEMYSGVDRLTAEALMEGYRVLTEGYTRKGMELGRYLRSLDGGKVAKPGTGVHGEDQYMYVMLARKPRAVAEILAACAGDDERECLSRIEKGLSGYAGRDTFYQDRLARGIWELRLGTNDRSLFGKAAEEYARGNCEAGFKILKGIPGFNLCGFVNFIKDAAGEERGDRGNISLNPDAKMSRVMNRWLFHGTSKDSAVKIALHGFDRGNRIGELAYNDSEGGAGMGHDYSGDYLFAYDADDLLEKGERRTPGGPWKMRCAGKYGAAKIVFKASGYKIYHSGDRENQVIFDYHEPSGCFLVLPRHDAGEKGLPAKRTKRDDWLDYYQVIGRGKDGKARVLYSGESVEDCILWARKNGDDYSGMMFRWR